jgi:hypothetical protein
MVAAAVFKVPGQSTYTGNTALRSGRGDFACERAGARPGASPSGGGPAPDGRLEVLVLASRRRGRGASSAGGP